MITLTELFIFGLATWRVASLLTKEAGPFRIFVKIREWAGIKHDADDKVWVIPGNSFAQLLSCVWCASLWIGLFFFIFHFLSPVFSLQIATVFSFSAAAIALDAHVSRKQE